MIKKCIVLIVLVVAFFAATKTAGQSRDFSFYEQLYTDDGGTWHLDLPSQRRIRNGNIVFWALRVTATEPHILIWFSQEANCTTRRARINGLITTDGEQILSGKHRTMWFPGTDLISKVFVSRVCR